MGMFDVVIITCPHCGEIVEEQTKMFDCIMETISLDEEVDSATAQLFSGDWKCDHCDKIFYVRTGMPATIKVKVYKENPGED